MKDSFLITWRSLWRGKTLWTLLAAVLAAHVFLPGFVRSDGTLTGQLEMHVRVVCGVVAAITYIAVLALSCGSFAREREEELLPLSLVRPASAFSVAAGRWLAITLLAACVLAFNAVLINLSPLTAKLPLADCRIHHAPALPAAEIAAAGAMETFLKSESTPDAVKKAPRAAILALLTAKENERYEVVRPGKSISWPFNVPADDRLTVSVRFSTLYNTRMALNGVFSYMGFAGVVSNNTQAILEVPLKPKMDIPALLPDNTGMQHNLELTFRNTGKTDLMLRPRRDVELLGPGDSFLANSVRATVEMLALVGLLAAFGLFLSAALSRPVAIFAATVLLAAALMAPDAVSQFPDEFHATMGEKAGLAISRAVTRFTAALSEVSPVADLAAGRAIILREMVRPVLADLFMWPCLFLALAAFIVRRKTK